MNKVWGPGALGSAARGLAQLRRSLLQTFAERASADIGPAGAICLALALVAGMTAALLAVTLFVELHHVSSAYLIPVLVAATKLGVWPAILAAVAGMAASAFFFYEPIYDFRVSDPGQLLDLPLFIFVATVTGQLAARARTHSRILEERENEMRTLYEFSRRLAVATDAPQIYSAIQHHLSAVTGCRVLCFDATSPLDESAPHAVPLPVLRKVEAILARRDSPETHSLDDAETGTTWLISPLSNKASFALVAVDIGQASARDREHVRAGVNAILADAGATLDRLDVAKVIGDAKLRQQAETLRAALIGSVSHGLRTPLASILGSASILIETPRIKADPRVIELANIIRDSAERLDGDIQRLLDASTISSAGVQPKKGWADPADIVNTALAKEGRLLAAHKISRRIANDMELVHVDSVLIEQALCQILDNAAKYSKVGSTIEIEARDCDGQTIISVADNGGGLSDQDHAQMFDRFYRGSGGRDTSGSGLGLWIARAFVSACGGRLEAESAGMGMGSRLSIILPRTQQPEPGFGGGLDD